MSKNWFQIFTITSYSTILNVFTYTIHFAFVCWHDDFTTCILNLINLSFTLFFLKQKCIFFAGHSSGNIIIFYIHKHKTGTSMGNVARFAIDRSFISALILVILFSNLILITSLSALHQTFELLLITYTDLLTFCFPLSERWFAVVNGNSNVIFQFEHIIYKS